MSHKCAQHLACAHHFWVLLHVCTLCAPFFGGFRREPRAHSIQLSSVCKSYECCGPRCYMYIHMLHTLHTHTSAHTWYMSPTSHRTHVCHTTHKCDIQYDIKCDIQMFRVFCHLCLGTFACVLPFCTCLSCTLGVMPFDLRVLRT